MISGYYRNSETLKEQAGLDLANGNGVLLRVKRRVEDHLHDRCDPHVRQQQQLPVAFHTVLAVQIVIERLRPARA